MRKQNSSQSEKGSTLASVPPGAFLSVFIPLIVLINDLGPQLLNLLAEAAGNLPVDLYLANAAGYWLSGPLPEHE